MTAIGTFRSEINTGDREAGIPENLTLVQHDFHVGSGSESYSRGQSMLPHYWPPATDETAGYLWPSNQRYAHVPTARGLPTLAT